MSTDRFVIRVVVVTVALLAAVALIAMCGLALRHDPIPQDLKESFLMLAAALVGLLAKTSTPADDTQQVHVVNEPDEPIPVEPGA